MYTHESLRPTRRSAAPRYSACSSTLKRVRSTDDGNTADLSAMATRYHHPERLGNPRWIQAFREGTGAFVDEVGNLLAEVFHYLALFAIGGTVAWSAVIAFLGMTTQGHASIGDILLLFIYLELGAMVGVYFKRCQLGLLLPLRRRHLRPAFGQRGLDGVLPEVHLRRLVFSWLGQADQDAGHQSILRQSG
jgi:Phosphate-starvation-inducible E family